MQALGRLFQQPVKNLFHGRDRLTLLAPLNDGAGQGVLVFQGDKIHIFLRLEKIRGENVVR